MLPDRYYVTEIQEGPKARRFYFYASLEGLTGPEYGYAENGSWVAQAYESAIHEARERLASQPGWIAAEFGAVVTTSGPREISPDELVRLDPCVNVPAVNAIKLTKQEIEHPLDPIRVTWCWQSSEESKNETVVYLKLSDDTGASSRVSLFSN